MGGVGFLLRFPEIQPTSVVVVATLPVLVLFDLVVVPGMLVGVEEVTTVEKEANVHFVRCSYYSPQRTHLLTQIEGGTGSRT